MQLLLDANVFAPEPLGLRHLLIGEGRILWMGTERLELPATLEVEVHDLGGRRLIPGLIDGHAHVTGGGGETGYGSSVSPLDATVFLQAGVTTVVGLLGTDDCVRTTAQLVHQVYGLRARGLGAFCYTGGYHLPPMTLTGSIRSDLCHVDPILGFGELALSDHRSSQPTFEEFVRVASECHVGGLMTGKAGTCHLHMGDGRRGLELVRRALEETELPPRTFHPTHVNRRRALFEEALELTARGVTIDITAAPEGEGPVAGGLEDELPASLAVKSLLERGVARGRWTVSSDGGGCLPKFDGQGRLLHLDVGRPDTLPALMARLLEQGVALEDLLPGFTSNPADLLRFPDRGRIAVGARADLVLLGREGHGLEKVWCGGRAQG